MPRSGLTACSYAVLGLLAAYGPATPYELKRRIDGSVGYFWSFPRAQLYVEPNRLAARGLVVETREDSGRRRRTYGITEAGRETLRRWFREGGEGAVELRDPGLLRLFFAGVASPEEVVALARDQAAAHARRLAEYERIQEQLAGDDRQPFASATLRLGLMHEQASAAFWRDLAANPPAPLAASGSRVPGIGYPPPARADAARPHAVREEDA